MRDFVIDTFHRLIDELEVTTYRYLYASFELRDRLIGLIGPRGVGKTTLLLQYIKNKLYKSKTAFYFSADLVYFDSMNLVEFVADLYHNGGYRTVFIDEIHKYANWNQELKNLYDSFPKLQIIFSGSSMLDLIQGGHDLSRRAVLYHLRGMSFREYLNFNEGVDRKTVSWEGLLAGERLEKIEKLEPTFQSYLERGYYPFAAENPATYYEKLHRVIDKTIYEDIANFYKLKTVNLHYFKRILAYLATIPPGEVNVQNLAKHLKIDHKTVSHYLQILNDVGLIRLIYPKARGSVGMRKPQKLFLHNTTLLNALGQFSGVEISKGNQRETFFLQSVMDSGKDLFYSKVGDFLVEGGLFEIGGKGKTRKQIQNADLPAYIVKDGLRVAHGKELPLYHFGFLY